MTELNNLNDYLNEENLIHSQFPFSGNGTTTQPIGIEVQDVTMLEPLAAYPSNNKINLTCNCNETVLFNVTGSAWTVATSAGEISESRKNFERIYVGLSVHGSAPQDGASWYEISNRSTASYVQFGFGGGGVNQYYALSYFTWVDDTHFSIPQASVLMHSTGSNSFAGHTQYTTGAKNCVHTIIGVNRISG